MNQKLYFELLVRQKKRLNTSHHTRDHLFFFGMWFTVILRNISNLIPFRGLKRFTWSPTLIFFVNAPCGNTAWTCGTTVLETIPPSGPMAWTSCLILDITAKYWGKSWLIILVVRPLLLSSNWFKSENMLISRAISSLTKSSSTMKIWLTRYQIWEMCEMCWISN